MDGNPDGSTRRPEGHQPIDERRFPIDPRVLRSNLDKVRYIRCAWDLDLLLFFYRHPCALLAREQVLAHLGYGSGQAGDSLDGLVHAGVLTRSRSRFGAACLYALDLRSPRNDALSALLRIATTPAGRRGVKRLLKSAPEDARLTVLPDRGPAPRVAA